MEQIELTTATDDLADQLDFLIRLEFKNVYISKRNGLFFLLGLTLFAGFVYWLPDTPINIPLKGVLLTIIFLSWIAALTYVIWLFYKYSQRRSWRKKSIETAFSKKETFRFSFDEDRLHYSTEKYDTSLKWEVFKYYTEHKNSLFLCDEANPYQTLYYSKTELGHENYDRLREFAAKKLIPLSTIYSKA
ncbi:hypothetical protein [Flavihumibacter petaseus]|uniref:YcxB-like protein domain-containing protein n=1 Tax=Flavihumibacter petaseus NBRC 106054 TaxID=1220578 RepID=A0A0E9N7M0_9BACT|nr:hypothetical protein [Flavihumibacter petaseus]GAO45355.1 hypothetical protein FPE01S_05_00520 [Flavihumibacter petaseus NBRC 106054]